MQWFHYLRRGGQINKESKSCNVADHRRGMIRLCSEYGFFIRSTGKLFQLIGHLSIRHSVEKEDLCEFQGFLHQSAAYGSKIAA
jgi:hypothetical protein